MLLLKRVFPGIWFGGLAIIFLVMVWGVLERRVPVPVLLAPMVMAGFGYAIMKPYFDLADEVWDAGPELLVKNKGCEVHVRLTDIGNVSYSAMQNPRRVTLILRHPTSLGKVITFLPPTKWGNWFATNPVVEDLIQRIEAAGGKRVGVNWVRHGWLRFR
jgi:hypothetical protein